MRLPLLLQARKLRPASLSVSTPCLPSIPAATDETTPSKGPECIEGTIAREQLLQLRRDQTVDNREHRYLDEPYHASRVYNLEDIEVPLLSVANLGGNTLHLRGNVMGYLEAGSKNKWLWFISGRHDLPFYLPHYVELQKSCASVTSTLCALAGC